MADEQVVDIRKDAYLISRNKKGFEFGPSIMFSVFFALAAGLFIFLAFNSTSGFLYDVQQWLNDLFGDSDTEDKAVYVRATTSVSSLVCAINSIAPESEGANQVYSQDGCSELYKPYTIGGGIELPDPDALTSTEDDSGDEEPVRNAYFSCNEEVTECKITDFQLPQDVSDGKEWIAGFGDPRFLVFYRQFPAGEDAAWAGWSQWFQGSGTIVFASMCASKLLFYGGYGIARPISAGRKLLQLPTETLKAGYRGARTAVSGAKLLPGTVRKFYYLGDDVIKSGSRKEMLDKLYTYTAVLASETFDKTALKTWTTFKNVAPRTAEYTAMASGAAGLASYKDARFHTEFGKYIPEDGVLLLQEAVNKEPLLEKTLELSQIQSASSETSEKNLVDIAMPILLMKDSDDLRPFYLASPCRADIDVKVEKDVRCISYSYDGKKGSVFCDSPEKESWINSRFGIKPCGSVGVFGTHFEEDFQNKISDLVENKMQKEIIFQDTDGDDRNDIAKEPFFGFTFELETDPSNIICCRYDKDENPEVDDFSFGWVTNEYCGIVVGEIKESVNCDSKPLGLITRITDPTSRKWSPAVTSEAGVTTWGCYKKRLDIEEMSGGYFTDSWGDILMFGEGKEIVKCSLANRPTGSQKSILDSLLEKNKDLSDIMERDGILWGFFSSSETSDIELIGTLAEDGSLLDIDKILIYVTKENKIDDYILLSDFNSDGKLDGIKTYVLDSTNKNPEGLSDTIPTRSFVDSDFDGKADSVEATLCKVDAITATPDKSRYSSEENNFCYTERREVVGIATTVASFAIDVFVKKIPSPISWALGTATDCYLAYNAEDWTTPDWPGKN